ncbi:MAG: class I SAM-dependent methyltransferase [Syntrophorhabdaceae bacterium]
MAERQAGDSLDHLQRVQDFHDADAAGYRDRRYRDDTCEGIAYVTRKEIILGMAPVKPGKLLDIGCGPGILTRDLVQKGHDVYNADLSMEMIRTARKTAGSSYNGHLSFIVGDASLIPFSAGKMDVVLSIGLMCYIKNHSGVLSEIYRVLKPGGFAIIQINNIRWPALYRMFTPVYHALKSILFGKKYDSLNFEFNFSSTGTFLKTLAANKFRVRDLEYYDFRIPFIDITLPNFSVKMGKAMYRNRKKSWLKMFAHGLLIKVEK